MRSYCDTALSMDFVELGCNRQRVIDDVFDSDGDDVMKRRDDFLTGENCWSAELAHEPSADSCVDNFIVSGDRDCVQVLLPRLERQSNRRESAVAPCRAVSMKIGRNDAITGEHQRRLVTRVVNVRAETDSDHEDDAGDEGRSS